MMTSINNSDAITNKELVLLAELHNAYSLLPTDNDEVNYQHWTCKGNEAGIDSHMMDLMFEAFCSDLHKEPLTKVIEYYKTIKSEDESIDTTGWASDCGHDLYNNLNVQ